MREKYEVVAAMFHGFDYARSFGGPPSERLAVIPAAMEHILQQPDGKKRFMQAVAELAKAFALAVPHERALAIRDDVGFVQRFDHLIRPGALNHGVIVQEGDLPAAGPADSPTPPYLTPTNRRVPSIGRI